MEYQQITVHCPNSNCHNRLIGKIVAPVRYEPTAITPVFHCRKCGQSYFTQVVQVCHLEVRVEAMPEPEPDAVS